MVIPDINASCDSPKLSNTGGSILDAVESFGVRDYRNLILDNLSVGPPKVCPDRKGITTLELRRL